MVWSERRVLRFYFGGVCLAVALTLALVFFLLAGRGRALLWEQVLDQGRTLFKSMVTTRQWNAGHGGVYVLKTPGTARNPYLDHPEVETRDGRTLTLVNPATMTREISDLSRQNRDIVFHITSLRLVNPANAPTPFETEALQAFERGVAEASQVDDEGGRRVFRYMAPLKVVDDCLPCHARQGYKVGDTRGGISVNFDVTWMEHRLTSGAWATAGASLLSIALVTGLLALLFRDMRRKLEASRELLREMAETDELTGLANRRHVLARFAQEFERAARTGQPLSCVMFDIDHFKRINDTHGHQAGDAMLRAVAANVREGLRGYDLLGRIGGEEFLVVAPGLDREGGAKLAERLRLLASRENAVFSDIPAGTGVTVSLGVTGRTPQDESIEEMLRRADAALYEAKQAGRDRVAAR